MRYPWIDGYLMKKRGVTKDLQADWNWQRYMIGGKMFAAILLDGENRPYYINLKLDPVEGEMMRRQYPDIIAGYYSDKRHWNSVNPDGDVPDEILKQWLDRSYDLVLRGFPKAKQREILDLSVCGTDCADCPLHGSVCAGCNKARGRVFHAPEGQPCAIYACCVNRRRYAACAACDEMPCGVWRATRDPNMTDEQFEKSIAGRAEALRSCFPAGPGHQ